MGRWLSAPGIVIRSLPFDEEFELAGTRFDTNSCSGHRYLPPELLQLLNS